MQPKCALYLLVTLLAIAGSQGAMHKMRQNLKHLEHNHLREPQPIDPGEIDNEDESSAESSRSGEVETEKEEEEEEGSIKTDCPTCGDGAASAEEIRKVRIEKIKQRILHKLRLKTRPNITISRADLPTPLSHGELSRFRGDSNEPHLRYEYYGTTEHVIIFPDEESYPCFLPHQHPAECLRFSKTSGLPSGEISSAELWVYKVDIGRNDSNHTFRVSELVPDHRNSARRKHSVDQIHTTVENGWIKFNVKNAVKYWRHHHSRKEHWLEVICHSCATGHSLSPISMELGQRPFLVLSMNNTGERQRSKRSVNCSPGTTHCCRESLFISFQEIGWDDWIIQPAGYTANYCRGSCAEEGAIPLSRNHHSTMMQRYVQNQNLTPSQKMSLSPCCTPARMSQISLLYVYDDGQVYQSNLPDMVVDACGCS